MASRRLCSSWLRSSLRTSPPESQLPSSTRRFSTPAITSRLSSIPIRIFSQTATFTRFESGNGLASVLRGSRLDSFQQAAMLAPPFPIRFMSTQMDSVKSSSQDSSTPGSDVPSHIKFKRLDKTAKHIMQILNKEAVEEVGTQGEIPDIRPGYIVQLKVEVPENKRCISIIKGIVIARKNAGLNTTYRIMRQVTRVGVEFLFPPW